MEWFLLSVLTDILTRLVGDCRLAEHLKVLRLNIWLHFSPLAPDLWASIAKDGGLVACPNHGLVEHPTLVDSLTI